MRFIILLLFTATALFARDIEVLVEDAELGLPLDGAVIRLWDGRQFVCAENGKAHFDVPDNRQLVIQGSYPGYENGRLAITPDADLFILKLRLSGIMENRELVVEASRPGESETKTGRSIAVSGRDITQTAEIGIVEDVMSTIKLLPGVGYAGFFNAQPSIRGGDPGDMRAFLDGYYVMNPYHWSGGYSIFDPRMVQSAQLSHGVFSSRYGHSISGLLDISSKKPSSTETEFELGVSTSAASFNISIPFAGKGGILLMGRITYYDPVIAIAKQLAKSIEALDVVNSIRVAPFIRSGSLTGNYRFSGNLELKASGFWGMDGAGATFINGPTVNKEYTSSSKLVFDWINYQGFITSTLNWNPRNDMLLKISAGTGYEKSVIDGDNWNDISEKYFSDSFKTRYPVSAYITEPYHFSVNEIIKEKDTMFNAQARVDYDWELGKGFFFAAGVQEMYTRLIMKGEQLGRWEKWLVNFDNPDDILRDIGIDPDDPANDLIVESLKKYLRISYSASYPPDAGNSLFTSSAYSLLEYFTPNERLRAELGLRFDHYYLLGKDFHNLIKPALNPRLNIDFNVIKNKLIIQSLDISAGIGLFSSIDNAVFQAEKKHNAADIKPNRSLTSVLGAKIEFPEDISFNIEGYYKYIFDRMYIPVRTGLETIEFFPQNDGVGKVWGIDLMLQKKQSRFLDGWLTYSFNWAKYRDPQNDYSSDINISGGFSGNEWYFPYYHRFHNLNLILNIKPAPKFNIYIRFGFASGTQISKRDAAGPISYPVYDLVNGLLIEKYYWLSRFDEKNRSTPTLPLDIKFSVFGKNKKGKSRYELYFALENVLILLYYSKGNTSYNVYTGEVLEGSNSANFEIPIPIPSFGFKVSY